MRKKQDVKLPGIMFLFMFVFLTFAIQSRITVEAASGVVVALKPGKTYKYDLDKDGKKEKIEVRYTNVESIGDGAYSKTDVLSINGKNVYEIVTVSTPVEGTYMNKKEDVYYINGQKKRTEESKIWEIGSTVFFITDVNKSDRQMEILVARGWNIDDLNISAYAYALPHLWYCSYKKGIFAERQDLRFILETQYGKKYLSSEFNNIHACSGASDAVFKTDGKGNLFFETCLYMKGRKLSMDYLHINDSLMLKNGKFVKPTEKEYKASGILGVCQSAIKVYTTPICKKVKFTLKKNDKINIEGIYCKNKNTFCWKVEKWNQDMGYVKLNDLKAKQGSAGSSHV